MPKIDKESDNTLLIVIIVCSTLIILTIIFIMNKPQTTVNIPQNNKISNTKDIEKKSSDKADDKADDKAEKKLPIKQFPLITKILITRADKSEYIGIGSIKIYDDSNNLVPEKNNFTTSTNSDYKFADRNWDASSKADPYGPDNMFDDIESTYYTSCLHNATFPTCPDNIPEVTILFNKPQRISKLFITARENAPVHMQRIKDVIINFYDDAKALIQTFKLVGEMTQTITLDKV